MNGRYLLDSNIVIALLAGEAGVRKSLGMADEVFLPSTTIGELYYGAWKSSRSDENLARIDELVRMNVVLPCDSETARRYGELKHLLHTKGRPLPENDIWIAAIARQHDLTLVTRDTHFAQIDDLNQTVW